MDQERFLTYSTDEFVLDKEFINWILHPDKESDLLWAGFLEAHPVMKNRIREAAFMIRSMQPVESEFIQPSLDRIYLNIQRDNRVLKLRVLFTTLKYAAGLLLFIGAGSLWLIHHRQNSRFPVLATDVTSMQKGKIILSDGSFHEFETRQTTIEQTRSGMVMINSDTINKRSASSALHTEKMNQIIIPYGKRSGITLADGSRIWMNSGSQLSYPTEFKKDSREVFLSGEAFFDVKSDNRRPFYVVTRDVKIKVLGTRFNVSSYEEDHVSQTVLIKGNVKIIHNTLFSRSVELEPGERYTYDKVENTMVKDKVDVRLYSSWVDGFLIFENEPVTDIFVKLERYYNQKIITDPALNKITFSGKLDLKENMQDVLYNISFASSLHITQNGEYYIIKP